MSEAAAECKCPEGIPAWVMTFADLMSLLLAFFVLLFSFSEMDKESYKQIAGSMKMAFGVQREIKVKEPPKGINIIAKEFSPGRPVPTPFNEVRQSTTDDHHKEPLFTDPVKIEQQDEALPKELNSLGDDQEKLQQPLLEKIPLEQLQSPAAEINPFEDTIDEVEMRLQADGDMIRKALSYEIRGGLIEVEVEDRKIVIRIKEKGSFGSGSAQPIKSFKKVVGKISGALRDIHGKIVVSGHTDNIPINTRRFRSNWELSASRSVSVVHELKKDTRLKENRFQIVAYADTRPLDSNKTSQGRSRNRRVEITLNYDDIAKELLPPGPELIDVPGKPKPAPGKSVTPSSAKSVIN